MNPITEAITAELSERRERKATLDREAETLDLQIGHLEALLTLAEEGPVIPVADPYEDIDVPPRTDGPLEDLPVLNTEEFEESRSPEPKREPEDEKPTTTRRKGQHASAETFERGVLKLASERVTFTARDVEVLNLVGASSIPKRLKEMVDAEQIEVVVKGVRGRKAEYGAPGTIAAYEDVDKAAENQPPPPVERRDDSLAGQIIRDAEELEEAPEPPKPTAPADPAPDTHTARNGEDIDDVVYEEIEDEGPLEYHEIVTATGESGVLIKAALGRLKAQNRIDEGEDGKFRICLNQSPREAAEAATEAEPNADLRKRIIDIIRAHNGAGERVITGMIRDVANSEIAAELKRMEADDLINWRGVMRQWKLIED